MTAKPTAKTEPKSALLRRSFDSEPAAIMEKINASIAFDQRLYAHDIAGSKAHCAMLVARGILSEADGRAIQAGLDRVSAEIEAGDFTIDPRLEDIHMHIEARLTELIGEAGKRLHTARSRNDQVATDLRLWLRDALARIDGEARDLQAALITRAEEHVETVMPGFTHSQPAQPVVLAHHLLAYVEMLDRDRGRFRDARARLNECPLGAAALAGTSFDIDRAATARALGFTRAMANSIDAVAARDFALEALAAAAIAATHLSRLAEELVLWSSAAFGFVRLSDAFATGSSIMPQKRNPDAAELVRGKTGRMIGDLTTLLVTMKGLPLAYAKDLQEDKEPLFDSLDNLSLCLRAMAGMIRDLEVDKARMRAFAGAGHSTATDLADWLVRAQGLPFRDAHQAAAALVRLAEQRGCALEALPLDEMRKVEPRLGEEARKVLGVDNSVASRTSFGGTAPARVREALKAARERVL